MLAAFLHGKLSVEQQNMEDLLTSVVFGSLETVDPQLGLLPFIGKAINVEDQLLQDAFVKAVNLVHDIEYLYWKKLRYASCEPCEPDLLIHINSLNCLICIEAKYNSGLSSFADEDLHEPPKQQLAKQWDNLLFLSYEKQCTPFLIFLTKDYQIPKSVIIDAKKEFALKRGAEKAFDIYWLSWSHLLTIQGPQNEAIAKLKKLIVKLDLDHFRKWEVLSVIPAYEFKSSESFFRWDPLVEIKHSWN